MNQSSAYKILVLLQIIFSGLTPESWPQTHKHLSTIHGHLEDMEQDVVNTKTRCQNKIMQILSERLLLEKEVRQAKEKMDAAYRRKYEPTEEERELLKSMHTIHELIQELNKNHRRSRKSENKAATALLLSIFHPLLLVIHQKYTTIASKRRNFDLKYEQCRQEYVLRQKTLSALLDSGSAQEKKMRLYQKVHLELTTLENKMDAVITSTGPRYRRLGWDVLNLIVIIVDDFVGMCKKYQGHGLNELFPVGISENSAWRIAGKSFQDFKLAVAQKKIKESQRKALTMFL